MNATQQPQLENQINPVKMDITDTSKITLSPAEVSNILGISLSGTYTLMAQKNFPSFRVGRRWFVTKYQLQNWINQSQ